MATDQDVLVQLTLKYIDDGATAGLRQTQDALQATGASATQVGKAYSTLSQALRSEYKSALDAATASQIAQDDALAANVDRLKSAQVALDQYAAAQRTVQESAGIAAANTGGFTRALQEHAAATHSSAAAMQELGFSLWNASGAMTQGVSGLGMLLGYSTSMSVAGVTLAGVLGGALVKAGSDFNESMLHLQGNTAITDQQLAYIRQHVLELGQQFPVSFDQISQAYERAYNLGFQMQDATDLVTASLKAAMVTGANAADVMNTLGTVMSNFHEPASKGTADMAILMKAAGDGNIHLQDLATNFSKIGELASAMRMPITDAAATFSTLTKALGGDASVAQTQFVGMLQHILAPTPQVISKMQELKQATGVDLVKAFSDFSHGLITLPQLLQDASKATNDNQGEIEKLFGGIRGGMGAVALLGSQWQNYIKTLNDVRDPSIQTGSWLDKIAQKAGGELPQRLQQLRNDFDGLAVDLSTDLIPAVDNGVTALDHLLKKINDFVNSGAGKTLGDILGKIGNAYGAVAGADMSANAWALGKVAGGIGDANAFLGGGSSSQADALKKLTDEYARGSISLQTFKEALVNLPPAHQQAALAAAEHARNVELLGNLLGGKGGTDGYVQGLVEITHGHDAAKTAIDAQQVALRELNAQYQALMASSQAASQLTASAGNVPGGSAALSGLQSVVDQLPAALRPALDSFVQGFSDKLTQADQTYIDGVKSENSSYQNQLQSLHTKFVQQSQGADDAKLAKLEQSYSDEVAKLGREHDRHLANLQTAFDKHARSIEEAIRKGMTPAGEYDALKKGLTTEVDDAMKALVMAMLEHKGGIESLTQAYAKWLREQNDFNQKNADAQLAGAVATGNFAAVVTAKTKELQDAVSNAQGRYVYDSEHGASKSTLAHDQSAIQQAKKRLDDFNASIDKGKPAVDKFVQALDDQRKRLEDAVTEAQGHYVYDQQHGASSAQLSKDQAGIDRAKANLDRFNASLDKAKPTVDQFASDLSQKASTGLNQVAYDLYQHHDATEKDIDSAVRARERLDAWTDSVAKSKLLLDERTGNFKAVQSDKQQNLQDNYDKALAKVETDLQTHSRSLGADVATLQQAKAALDSYNRTVKEAEALAASPKDKAGTFDADRQNAQKNYDHWLSVVAQDMRTHSSSLAADEASLRKAKTTLDALDQSAQRAKDSLDTTFAGQEGRDKTTAGKRLDDYEKALASGKGNLDQLRQAAIDAALATQHDTDIRTRAEQDVADALEKTKDAATQFADSLKAAQTDADKKRDQLASDLTTPPALSAADRRHNSLLEENGGQPLSAGDYHNQQIDSDTQAYADSLRQLKEKTDAQRDAEIRGAIAAGQFGQAMSLTGQRLKDNTDTAVGSLVNTFLSGGLATAQQLDDLNKAAADNEQMQLAQYKAGELKTDADIRAAKAAGDAATAFDLLTKKANDDQKHAESDIAGYFAGQGGNLADFDREYAAAADEVKRNTQAHIDMELHTQQYSAALSDLQKRSKDLGDNAFAGLVIGFKQGGVDMNALRQQWQQSAAEQREWTKDTILADEATGQFTAAMDALTKQINDDTTNAFDKIRDAIHNNQPVSQDDIDAYHRLRAAQDQLTTDTIRADLAVGNLADAFSEEKKRADSAQTEAASEFAQKWYDIAHGIQDSLPPLDTLRANLIAAAQGAADFTVAMDHAQAIAALQTPDGQAKATQYGQNDPQINILTAIKDSIQYDSSLTASQKTLQQDSLAIQIQELKVSNDRLSLEAAVAQYGDGSLQAMQATNTLQADSLAVQTDQAKLQADTIQAIKDAAKQQTELAKLGDDAGIIRLQAQKSMLQYDPSLSKQQQTVAADQLDVSIDQLKVQQASLDLQQAQADGDPVSIAQAGNALLQATLQVQVDQTRIQSDMRQSLSNLDAMARIQADSWRQIAQTLMNGGGARAGVGDTAFLGFGKNLAAAAGASR